MKLLALNLCEHDNSYAYFDGQTVRYYSLERSMHEKRFSFNDTWSWKYEIKKVWDIDHRDIDEIIIVRDKVMRELTCGSYGIETAIDIVDPTVTSKLYIINHHFAHSLSYWPALDKKPDVSIVIDGLGDDKSWTVFKDDKIIDSSQNYMNSIGEAMIRTGYMLGIDGLKLDIAGKLMGLQSYGNIDSEYLQFLQQYNIGDIDEIFNPFNWNNIKGEDVGNHTKLNWINTVHFRIGEILVEFFRKYMKTDDDVVFYSGGVAHNVLWNTTLKKHFKNLVILPHSSDDGLCLGALEWLRSKNDLPQFKLDGYPFVQSDIEASTADLDTIKIAAKLLSEGKIVAWYQGKGEIGPRALGNRSILMDPRIENAKDIINKVKNREQYRPFGASVLKQYSKEYFDLDWDNPYMLYVGQCQKPELKSITHVDGTCRVQTVDETNQQFNRLLVEFHNLTGCPVLLNTSLNIAGKPIAGVPEEAIHLYDTTNIDAIFVGNELDFKG
jgi:carbamoyltransferase